MYVQNPLIKWYVRAVQRLHRHPQRKRRTRIIQTTRLVHHMLVEHRSDLVRLRIIHRPHRPNDRTESNKLHS